MNKDSRILNELKRADTLHEKYKSEMTGIVKDISGLEITIRKEKLREQFFDAAKLFAQVQILIKREMYGDGGSALSVERLANFAAVQLLPALPIEAIEALYADPANRLKQQYCEHHDFDCEDYDGWKDQVDQPLCDTVAADLKPLLLGATTDLIRHHHSRDRSRNVNATLKEFLTKFAMKESCEDVEYALNEEDENGNQAAPIDMLPKSMPKRCKS